MKENETFTNEDLMGCAQREIAYRCEVYKKIIERNPATRERLEKELKMMRAIRDHFKALCHEQPDIFEEAL